MWTSWTPPPSTGKPGAGSSNSSALHCIAGPAAWRPLLEQEQRWSAGPAHAAVALSGPPLPNLAAQPPWPKSTCPPPRPTPPPPAAAATRCWGRCSGRQTTAACCACCSNSTTSVSGRSSAATRSGRRRATGAASWAGERAEQARVELPGRACMHRASAWHARQGPGCRLSTTAAKVRSSPARLQLAGPLGATLVMRATLAAALAALPLRRYLLKLFRDFLFHQVSTAGTPCSPNQFAACAVQRSPTRAGGWAAASGAVCTGHRSCPPRRAQERPLGQSRNPKLAPNRPPTARRRWTRRAPPCWTGAWRRRRSTRWMPACRRRWAAGGEGARAGLCTCGAGWAGWTQRVPWCGCALAWLIGACTAPCQQPPPSNPAALPTEASPPVTTPAGLAAPRSAAQVLLMSRDELAMLVVSYADIRRCIASCYEELRGRASPAQGSGGMQRSRSRPSMQQQY